MGITQKAETFTLNNGLRVVYLPRPESQVCHCALMIDAGSRDERKLETGLAHYIEHCLFKGTRKRKTYHILNRLDSVGGEINAYTSKEDTVLHASFLTEHSERTIELISDIAFESTFPPKEIEKEKEVIMDEIQAYEETPSDIIFDDFDSLVFGNHPLGKPILGNEKTLRSFGKEDILRFQKRRYHPSKMVFAFHGNINRKKLRRLCDKYLAGFENDQIIRKRIKVPALVQRDVKEVRDTNQAHYIIGGRAYSTREEKKLPFLVLNNFLGGPAMNSSLNLNIREKHGIAYHLESHFTSYSDTGMFQVYMGTDKSNLERGISLIKKELAKSKNKALGTRQLHSAKEQIKGHIALNSDGGVNTVLSLAKSILLYDRIEDLDTILENIDAISASDIMEVANEVWDEANLSSITFV